MDVIKELLQMTVTTKNLFYFCKRVAFGLLKMFEVPPLKINNASGQKSNRAQRT